MRKQLLLLLGLTTIGAAFASDPVTPPPPANDDAARDAAVGKKYSEEVLKQYKESTNEEFKQRLNRIGQELATIANDTQVNVSWGSKKLNKFEYHFTVLQGDDVNAFSLPGGYLYFFEGLIKNAESDDELAGVVAHEISHSSFRHLATLQKEMSKLDPITIPLILIGLLRGGETGMGLYTLGNLTQQAFGSGWSQKAEEAADYGALQYMQKSKYNPTGLVTFMERLAFKEKNSPKIDWGIYRTHPPSRERASELVKDMNEIGIKIKRSEVTKTFKTQVIENKTGGTEIWFADKKVFTFYGSNALNRAEKAATRLDTFMDSMPEMFDVRALPDGTIIGRGSVLWKVTEDDLTPDQKKLTERASDAVLALKRGVYNLSYRTWTL